LDLNEEMQEEDRMETYMDVELLAIESMKHGDGDVLI